MDTPLLQITDLNVSVETDQGKSRILRDVSFAIRESETVALVGESGSGKSVTALSILRLLETIASVETRGSIIFKGEDICLMQPKGLRALRGNRISMVFQEPMTSLNPVYSIRHQLTEVLALHRAMGKKEALKEAISLLDTCGIADPERKIETYPHQLSGGQRQRVMIAMALACRPELLIADEPTTALDVTIQAQILELIVQLQTEFQMALLLITHDLGMVQRYAEKVHIMKEGRIVESGPSEVIFQKAAHPYTIHLLKSVPGGTAEQKKIGPPLLTLRNINCVFQQKKGFFGSKKSIVQALNSVSLTIPRGSTFGLVGESGSGKSTLGLALLRLIRSQGEILYNDTAIHSMSAREMRPLRRELQIVFQDPFSSLSPRLTIGQIVEEGLGVHYPQLSRRQRRQKVEDILTEVGLEPDTVERYPHEFSGGQRQRIAIARAIILKPTFLVLDEPTSALDMTIQAQVIDLLKLFQKRYGITYLFISHDLKIVRALAHYIAVMKDGRIIESGTADEIFHHPTTDYTKTLFKAAFELTAS